MTQVRETRFSYHVLRAALIRKGVWLVTQHGEPTIFLHKACCPTLPQIRKAAENILIAGEA